MLRRSPTPVSLAAALVLLAASTADAHTLVAQGANACSDPLCTDTRLEGHYTDGGVPGVNLDYSFFNTVADSDSGQLTIDAGLEWIEGATRPGINIELINAAITENLVLTRLAPGPVTVHAALLFEPAAQIQGPGHSAVTLSATLAFADCQLTVHQSFSIIGADEIQSTGSGCELHGSLIEVTRTYDDALPTHLYLQGALLSDYVSIQKDSNLSVQSKGHLYFTVSNATADWDTPTFLTLAPEPEDDALALVAFGALTAVGARRRTAR